MIITTAAGRMQDLSATDSLDPAVSLWLGYAFVSVAISGGLLLVSYFRPSLLPAASLSQIAPGNLPSEINSLAEKRGIVLEKEENENEKLMVKKKEKILKSPQNSNSWVQWSYMVIALGIIVIGWVMFGVGVEWGVHGSVVAGSTGE